MGLKSCLFGAAFASVGSFVVSVGTLAVAAECVPQPAAILPVTLGTTSTMLVPAEIDGKQGSLMVDTGSSYSMIRPELADELGLQRSDLPEGVYGLAGRSIEQRTRAHALALGPVVEADRGFLIGPPHVPVDPHAMGILGGDVLGDFNLEIDPEAALVKLYSLDDCPGAVPPWAAGIAPTAIEVTPDNLIIFTARLDSQPVKAYLDTGATYSILDLGAAKRVFDLDRDSPGMEKQSGTRTGDGALLETYLHTFKSLEIAGISFREPLVSLIDERRRAHPETGTRIDPRTVSLPEFRIGMHQLRQLHVFVAYEARELYIAPIEGLR